MYAYELILHLCFAALPTNGCPNFVGTVAVYSTRPECERVMHKVERHHEGKYWCQTVHGSVGQVLRKLNAE